MSPVICQLARLQHALTKIVEKIGEAYTYKARREPTYVQKFNSDLFTLVR